jgi:hypothetical protein
MGSVDPSSLGKVADTRAQSSIADATSAIDATGADLDKARDAVVKGVKLKNTVADGFAAAKNVKDQGLKTAYDQARTAVVKNAQAGSFKVTPFGVALKGLNAVGVAASLYQLPGKVLTTVQDVRTALRTGDGQAWNKVASDVAATGKATFNIVRGSLELGRDITRARATYKAASAAFKAVVPNATRAVAGAAARSAMVQALEGATSKTAKTAVVGRVMTTAKDGSTLAESAGLTNRVAAKAALDSGGKAAAEAALEAGAKSAAGPIARAAGRFAPGVNIAIAAFDTANAAATLNDKTASSGKKITACITAVGSICAATNIPVLSQIGAGVSVVSSLVGGFFFSK